MNEREKLFGMIFDALEHCSYNCEICNKMGWECKVEIPENFSLDFKADFSKCDFKDRVYKTLTIEH